jgi:hypothetical protein
MSIAQDYNRVRIDQLIVFYRSLLVPFGKKGDVIMTNGTYPWLFVTQIFHSG